MGKKVTNAMVARYLLDNGKVAADTTTSDVEDAYLDLREQVGNPVKFGGTYSQFRMKEDRADAIVEAMKDE